MFPRIFLLAAVLLLSACASTSSYHRDYGGGDYYYGAASDGYYAREPERVCERSAQYGYYGSYRCQTLGWGEVVGAYPYVGWAGWGYPYTAYGNPYLSYNNRWGGSLWLGYGGFSSWGYPGYYNPWFGPWWPYAVSYPSQRRHFRDARRIHREQALQASWRRHDRRTSAAGFAANTRQNQVQRRQVRTLRRNGALQHPNRPRSFPQRSDRAPVQTPVQNMPRGRPSAGIPVNWPVSRQPARVRPQAPSHHQPVSRQPATMPRHRPEPIAPPRSDARISRQQLRSAPIRRSAPTQPVRSATPVQRSMPAARPLRRSAPPSRPATPSRSAPTRRASRPSSSASKSSHRGTPRGRPTRKKDD